MSNQRRLVMPGDILSTLLKVLKDNHVEHLAALERDKGLTPRTIEPFGSIDLMPADEIRLRGQKLPAILVGVALDEPPQRNKHSRLDFTWTVTAYVIVAGQSAGDVLQRRDWYAMTAIECLLGRTPRDGTGPIDALELTGMDFQDGAGPANGRYKTVADAQVTFAAETRDALDLRFLPPADTTIPPGTPGGPPETPYAEPTPWPASVTPRTDIDLV